MSDQKDWNAFALLLIDVQQDFWPADTAEAFPDFQSHVEQLLSFCRTSGIDIVHIRAQFEPDQSDWMVKYIAQGSMPCIRGTSGAEILPCAQEQPGEHVVIKHTFDAFHNPEVLTHLRQRHKRFILTAGLVTSVCVPHNGLGSPEGLSDRHCRRLLRGRSGSTYPNHKSLSGHL